MKTTCTLCKNEEHLFYKGIKHKFTSKKDFVCSKCTLLLTSTPRSKMERLPKDIDADIAELENLLTRT